MRRGCERLWELEPYREGRLGDKDAQSFERHLQVCAECSTQKRRAERLAELGRALAGDPPDELALRRVRARVLRDVEAGAVPATRRRLAAGLAVAAALAIAGVAAGVWWPRPAAPEAVAGGAAAGATASDVASPADPASVAVQADDALAGLVTASEGARWSQRRAAGIERVTLEAGELDVHVRPQRLGERFLVSLPDGEIEVRGTTFDVRVERGATARVQVVDGDVELRLRDREVVHLAAGETWTPPQARALAAPGARPAARSAGPSATAAPAEAEADVQGYAAAMALLRAGRNDEAATAFNAFALEHPAASQAQDASFLEGVALARAGRADAAGLAAERHLAAFPRSFHRKEAALLAARAAVQRGDCPKARALLAPWSDGETAATLRGCGGP